MKKILFVNSCVRDNSRTLRLAHTVLQCLDGNITEIKISEMGIKPLDKKSLELRTKMADAGDFSDSIFNYAHQFAQSDIVVIAAPYWDLSFPAVLKTYLEAISVCGITFKYNERGIPEGLCNIKKIIYVTTSGGSIGDFNMGYDYIKTLAEGLFNIGDIQFFSAENLDIYGNDVEAIMSKAQNTIKNILK